MTTYTYINLTKLSKSFKNTEEVLKLLDIIRIKSIEF